MAEGDGVQVGERGPRTAPLGTVLVIEDERVLAELVRGVLAEEGYEVAVVSNIEHEAVRAAVARVEPDCILLDGGGTGDYGESWDEATWAHTRERPVPVVMFTADAAATAEALSAESERSRRAAFFAVLAKPFDLDELLDVVARAVAAQRAALAVPAHVGAASAASRRAARAQAERRRRLVRLRGEVTELQAELRSNHLEHIGLMEQARRRSLTRDEMRQLHGLILRAEANRMRLAELRNELADLGPLAP